MSPWVSSCPRAEPPARPGGLLSSLCSLPRGRTSALTGSGSGYLAPGAEVFRERQLLVWKMSLETGSGFQLRRMNDLTTRQVISRAALPQRPGAKLPQSSAGSVWRGQAASQCASSASSFPSLSHLLLGISARRPGCFCVSCSVLCLPF